MANLKISQLTATTQNTIGSYVVINNSGETTTNKSQLKYVLGMTQGTGVDSIKSNDILHTKPSQAAGDYSIVIGSGASGITGSNSVVIGKDAKTESNDMVIIGTGAKDQGSGRDKSVAIGLNAEAYQQESVSVGYDSASVSYATSYGIANRSIGTGCVAYGFSVVAAGQFGLGIGWDTFSDRDGSIALGYQAYVDGVADIAIGDNAKTDNNIPYKIAIGYSTLADTAQKQIVMGYNTFGRAEGSIVINNDSDGAALGDAWSTLIAGSGNTWSVGIGAGNTYLGGFNNSIPYSPPSHNVFIGGVNNTFNATNGLGQGNTFINLSGRTIGAGSNTTYVENLGIYGQVTRAVTTYTGTTVTIDVGTVGYANVNALTSGSTYTIEVTPAPSTIGRELTLFIEYQDGATINFYGAGVTQWRWDSLLGTPSFSATTGNVSRSIIKVSTWDGNDMWEISRSMNME